MPEVPIDQLRPTCDPSSFAFETTNEVAPHIGLIGQQRAIDAIRFGLAMDSPGFNIVVTGEPGTGRATALREYLQEIALTKAPPDEWCYVNNFADPYQPRAMQFRPGQGSAFAHAMSSMIAEARELIPRTFSSEDFTKRRDQIVSSVQRQQAERFASLAARARESGFLLQGNPSGFFLVPLKDGEPVDDQGFAALSPEERSDLMRRRDELMAELRPVAKQGEGAEVEAQQRLQDLERTVATSLVDTLVDRHFEAFATHAEATQYLSEVRQDMIASVGLFIMVAQPSPGPGPMPGRPDFEAQFRKYEVNLLIDCSMEECARVVFESNPTPQHLFGSIEKEAYFGALTTDFSMIRGGSLHRANGGYLVLDFDDLLMYPISWNELKRTLRTREITIEELGNRLGLIETRTVRPEPIPWTGKVVGILRESVYRLLYTLDPDFRELFKVKANFDMRIDRTPQHELEYAGLIAAVTKREGLPPLDRGGVARVVEQGMRLAEDHNKLSILFGEISDVVREAAHWAGSEGASVVTAEHVERSIRERTLRVNLVEEKIREAIDKEIIHVSTQGEVVGQVNGLSVVDLGDTSFGQPSRITATVGVGREGVLDLQREAQMSGPIHSKAVLTLQGFLVDRYADETPVTLAARLSFEQSYGMIEGDSATCAEVCALLSRLAEAPIRQSLAITGSMDQHGEVQAIGGVNQKIEGFFDVCQARGLTGEQGVIVPASNVQHLMLRDDVVEAVKAGRFKVYAVSALDEALELLTGIAAGRKDASGSYPAESLNGRAQARLTEFARRLRAFSGPSSMDDRRP
ncbi:MAG TPA: ATP-binding protein [Dehalococcoidia bacterium]|nr:ATP-binding protein [Dehalococcoidia bacterium]